MIPFTIELNGVKVNKQIPTSWDEVTFDQYVTLLKINSNEIQFLSTFTGVEADLIAKAKIKGLDSILSVLEFLKEPPKFDDKPDKFMGRQMPKDITFEALGPYIDCRTILYDVQAKGIPEFVEAYAKYCAIYLQAIDTDWAGYDHDKAMLLVPEVMQQPAGEVVGLGSFFITRLVILKKNTASPSPTKATPPKKLKRGMKS
jgi:hypothetical protein